MRLCDFKKDSVVKVLRVNIKNEDIKRRLWEIGVAEGKNVRFIKRSILSKCVLVESMGSVFILDKKISEGIDCYE